MPLNLFYTMVQKSQKWPKTQIKGGSCLKREINMTQGINSYTAYFKFSLDEMNQNYKLKFAIDEQSNHVEHWVPFRWATENFFFILNSESTHNNRRSWFIIHDFPFPSKPNQRR